VNNLPLDGTGRLLVALPTIQIGSNALVLRSTTATYQGRSRRAHRGDPEMRAEFPSSHFTTGPELEAAYNSRGVVWLTSET